MWDHERVTPYGVWAGSLVRDSTAEYTVVNIPFYSGTLRRRTNHEWPASNRDITIFSVFFFFLSKRDTSERA